MKWKGQKQFYFATDQRLEHCLDLLHMKRAVVYPKDWSLGHTEEF